MRSALREGDRNAFLRGIGELRDFTYQRAAAQISGASGTPRMTPSAGTAVEPLSWRAPERDQSHFCSTVLFFEASLLRGFGQQLRGASPGAILGLRYAEGAFPADRRDHRKRDGTTGEHTEDDAIALAVGEDAGDTLTGHRTDLLDERTHG